MPPPPRSVMPARGVLAWLRSGGLAAMLLIGSGLITPATAAPASVSITSPTDYQVIKRNSENRADIAITGRYVGNPRAIQARWKGKPWATIDADLDRGRGAFAGTLRSQIAGYGPLEVRFSNLPSITDTATHIVIGDTKASIAVTSPTDYRVYQRGADDRADVAIAGHYVGNPQTIQARWRSGAWTTIDATLTRRSGTFYGVLKNQSAGQGTLHVRFSNLTGLVDSVTYVGVGDIFVMAGQSNMVGHGISNHQYTPTTKRASLLGNDYRWKELRDPYDSGVGQVDTISKDGGVPMGSWVAWFADNHLREVGVPVAFIPCARAGSTIAQWSRSTSRSTLYGSMLNRAKTAGGRVKAVLWFQGENDSNTTSDSYRASLNRLADNVASDLKDAPTIPAIIGSAPYAGEHRAGARIGTIAAVEENDHLLMGPALYDVNLDDEGGDGLHFTSDGDLSVVGKRFWAAVDDALYDGTDGVGPRLETATIDGGTVELAFDSALGELPADSDAFWIRSNGQLIPIESVDANDNVVVLRLATTPLAATTVSFGHDNRSGIENALYDEDGFPALPVRDVALQPDAAPAPEPGDSIP